MCNNETGRRDVMLRNMTSFKMYVSMHDAGIRRVGTRRGWVGVGGGGVTCRGDVVLRNMTCRFEYTSLNTTLTLVREWVGWVTGESVGTSGLKRPHKC